MTRTARALVCLALLAPLAGVSCAAPPRPAPTPSASAAPAPSPRPAPTIRRLALRTVPALVAAQVGAPALEVRLGDEGEERAWLLVGTGVAIHTLADVLLPRLRVPTSVAQHAEDAGAPDEVRLAHDVPLALAQGGELRLRAAALAPLPLGLAKLHVIGLLSPQLLAEDGEAVLIDPRASALAIGPADALVAESRARLVPSGDVRVCADVTGDGLGGHVPVRLYGLRAEAGGATGWMLVDSGAAVSRLREGGALAFGVAPDANRVAEPVPVRFAGARRTVGARLGRTPSGCGDDGALGADALVGCALVLGAERLWMRCD
jgi:hypothetical protein